MSDGLTTAEVAARTGATYRQLDHWVRRGWLNPRRVGFSVTGQGSPREWYPGDVAKAAVMVRLTAAGLAPSVAAEVASGQAEIAKGVRVEVTP